MSPPLTCRSTVAGSDYDGSSKYITLALIPLTSSYHHNCVI